MPADQMKRLSMRAVAREADVHITTVWRWTLKGVRGKRLPSFLVGGRRYVLRSELARFMHSGEPCEPSGDAARASALLDAAGVAGSTQHGRNLPIIR